MTRYALYFSPAVGSAWHEAGSAWLGRDAANGEGRPQPQLPGVPRLMMTAMTDEARRYGFHATLKAPFRLAEGFSEAQLIAMVQAFCRRQRPVTLQNVQVKSMGSFLALRPEGPLDDIGALAMRCVSYFDLLRAAPNEAELARRRRSSLTPRQEMLLTRWGYPYVEEEFRFHMTLTDTLDKADADVDYALRRGAEAHFASMIADTPLTIDALTVFREAQPGAPFELWQRFAFDAHCEVPGLPSAGRIFYCVGASGVGKDALLQWVRQHLPSETDTVFARRTITRKAHASEDYDAIDEAAFWQRAADGQFAMVWQANDLCYGIPRSIEADLAAGRDVVINGSREYLPKLLELFPQAQVIWIEADAQKIQERLQARQRESGALLLKRMERGAQFMPPESQTVIRIDNSGSLDNAGNRLLEILQR
jgi:phosphonate metabolism protein PhnN/1,5-bisphosphokinase (PRPP-forming)